MPLPSVSWKYIDDDDIYTTTVYIGPFAVGYDVAERLVEMIYAEDGADAFYNGKAIDLEILSPLTYAGKYTVHCVCEPSFYVDDYDGVKK